MSDNASAVLRLNKVKHAYSPTVTVLDGVNAELSAGELVALVGASGLGKSTLLHIAGLMEKPTDGEVWINGTHANNEATRTRLRREHIGFVFQFHHLLPEFTALENLLLVGRIGGQSKGDVRDKAMMLLDRVGLAARQHHLPSALSGGECQRIAIARALINSPSLLLLDEPTGNLDSDTAEEIFAMIEALVHQDKLACLYVTHNQAQARQADKQVSLIDKHWKVIDG